MILADADRLVLRRLSSRDVAEFIGYRNDPAVAQFQGWDAMDADEALKFLSHMQSVELLRRGKWTQLGVALKQGDTLIGDLGVHIAQDAQEAELGITLTADAQGQGLGFEAVELVCHWLFQETAINRIVAITHAQNTSALALLARTPFQHTHDTNEIIKGIPTPERWFERRRC